MGRELSAELVASVVLGLWMMFAPSVFGARGAMADSEDLAGALAVTFAAVALAEPLRALRFVNVALGAWIAAAPFILHRASAAGRWNAVEEGVALAALIPRRGLVRERYGSWDRFVM